MADKDFDKSAFDKAARNFEKAAECCGQGRFAAAKDLLLKGIKAYPEHSESHRLLGQIYFQEGETEKAIDTVLEALQIDPKNMWALILMGNIYAKDKDKVDVAEKYYKTVLEYYPDNAIAINNVAGVYLQRDDFESGIKYMQKSLELDSTYLNSYYGLALAYYKKDDLNKAFEVALEGAKKGKQRPEDSAVRQELLKLLLTIANDICEAVDYESKVFEVANRIKKEFGVRIEFELDENQDTLAHLEIGEFYHRDHHIVKYKKDGNYCHYMLHELMHLDMMLRAKQKGTLKVIGFKQKNFDLFLNEYKRHFDTLRKQYGNANAENVAKQLFQGMSLQVMNCPLDLFVEQKIYDKPEFRPLQIKSLFAMESGNIDAVKQTAGVAAFPQFIKDTNKLLNIVQSLMLRKLYSLDFVARYNPSTNMLANATRYFEKFEESLAQFKDGDEYALFELVASTLGLLKYFDVTKFVGDESETVEKIQTEADKRQERFNETHDPKNVDPVITVMMANYMVGAMEYFETCLPEEVKKIAFEIAMVGQNGISPERKSGYSLKSIPEKDFGGYELLAYYYVSWAQAVPEMLEQLGLPFDNAYAMALQMFNAKRGDK